MKVTPITAPLDGEHILATWPTIRPDSSDTRRYSDPEWRQRLRFWSGRSLTAQALERDQQNKAGRLAWIGRSLTPGIVQDLSVNLEAPAAPVNPLRPQDHYIHISNGYGLTCTGEDVVVPQPLRIALSDIPILNTDTANPAFPQVAVLALRPVELRRFDNEDPNDPCELDPSRDAFADEQRVDATQVVLIRIPDTLLTDFNLGDPTDPRWRNRLANALLSHATQQSARLTSTRLASNPDTLRWQSSLRSPIPSIWEQAGLPIALLSSETRAGAQRFFLDRYSVATRGAQAHPRSRPSTRLAAETSVAALNPHGSGHPLLWRARIDQFASHLSEFGAGADISSLSQHFQYVPPAGLLPKSAIQILTTSEAELLNQPDRAAVSKFFPGHLAIEALPVPIEDLDGILADSAPLAPIDFATTAPELIRILAPVSQASFEPDLLVIEKEDPIFLQEIGRLVALRQDIVQRRDFVQNRYDTLHAYNYGPPSSQVNPRLAIDQLEPEPTESPASFPFAHALRSPQLLSAPAAITIPFPSPQSLAENDALFARIRTDEDASPPVFELSWQAGSDSFSQRFTEAPAYPQETFDANGDPLATPLWRDFSARLSDLGGSSQRVSNITLRLDSGSIALGQIGRMAGPRGQQEIWWNAASETSVPITKGGTWDQIDRPALVAPFESDYQPLFKDQSSLDARLDELDTALKLPDGKKIRDIGITKVISNLEAEIKKGDDSVDLGFIKTQANIHRIRQVLLGKEAANELLTSPALSSVVDSKSARLSTEELLTAYRDLPNKTVDPSSSTVNAPVTNTPTPSTAAPTASTRDSAPPPSSRSASLGTNFFANPDLINTNFPTDSNIRSGDLNTDFNFEIPGGIRGDAKVHKNLNLFDQGLFSAQPPIPGKDDVIGSEPKIGQSFVPRDLTFTKRFDDGATNNAYSYSKAELETTFTKIPQLNLGIEDDSEVIPEVTDKDGKAVTFGQISIGDSAFLGGLKFPEATVQDSSSVLSNGVKLADLNVLVLRRFEFHIARRRALLAKARETRSALLKQLSLMASRLGVLAGRLSEARHDVSVARALRKEELDRVATINRRRDKILQEELKFLAYARPRFLNTATHRLSGWKARSQDYSPPIPTCLAAHGDTPPALKSFTRLFTHSPARWFKYLKPRLKLLDRLEHFQSLLNESQISSLQLVREIEPKYFGPQIPAASRFTIQSSFSVVRNWRDSVSKIPFTPSIVHDWGRLRDEAEKRSSLGDLISGKHGNAELSRRASGELENIEAIATCLHAEFSAVSPAIRLSWIDRYSQFDQPAPLHDLAILPHFQNFPRLTRQRFQAYVDWLFSRIDRSESDAENMVNDLIRICLLLASHAPIKEIVTGYVPRPTPIRPGIFIPILPFDLSRIRIGMHIKVWKKNTIVARAAVADLKDQEVSAKVSDAEITTIDPSMRIQFMETQYTANTQLFL